MSIERIRAEVEDVRREHRFERTGAVSGRLPYCSGVDARLCDGKVPCPTLRLAEKVLRLAEALEPFAGCDEGCGGTCCRCIAERVLAEVAGDDATRHEPDPDAGILGHSPEAWERSTRKFEEGR